MKTQKLIFLLAVLFLLVPLALHAQTHQFCPTDATCTWTGPQTFNGPVSIPGNVSVGGTLGAAKCSAIDGVVCADGQTGSDMGAKVNAAFAACTTTPCTVFIGVPGSYTYTTDIFFSAPATLYCADGVILNYTGTGKAVKMGPDGLTSLTASPQPYSVVGCQFSGGASATHGIYHNKFVIKSFVINTKFINFGNATAYNIFYQSQNWLSQINNVYMWSSASGPCFNGINVNGYDADNTTSDTGASFVQITNSHIQNITASVCSNNYGINIDSFNPQIQNTYVTGNFQAEIRLRRWSTYAALDHVYMETSGNSSAGVYGIMYGDVAGDPGASIGTFVDSAHLTNVYCNVHNTDFGTSAHCIGPATTSVGLQNSYLSGVSVAQMTAGQPVVVMNNLASQTENYAIGSKTSTASSPFSTLAFNTLHTAGGSITPWQGPDEATIQIRGNNIDFFTGSTFGGLAARWELGSTGNLYPFTAGGPTIGLSSLPIAGFFAGTAATNNFNFIFPAVPGARVITEPDLGVTTSTVNVVQLGSGSTALPVGALAANACAATTTVALTGATTSLHLHWNLASDPSAVTGYSTGAIQIYAWLTAGNVNFKQCSNSALTPGAMSVSWEVFN